MGSQEEAAQPQDQGKVQGREAGQRRPGAGGFQIAPLRHLRRLCKDPGWRHRRDRRSAVGHRMAIGLSSAALSLATGSSFDFSHTIIISHCHPGTSQAHEHFGSADAGDSRSGVAGLVLLQGDAAAMDAVAFQLGDGTAAAGR